MSEGLWAEKSFSFISIKKVGKKKKVELSSVVPFLGSVIFVYTNNQEI